jgi:hypothetical protein
MTQFYLKKARAVYNMFQLKHNNSLFFYSAFLILALNLLIFNKYFPLTEGWWETIGYLKNLGLEQHREFNLNFPPVIPTIFSILLKVTGNSFYYLRIIGIVIYLAVFFSLYKLLSIYFEDKNIAAFSSAVVLFLDIQGGNFIAKDYHTFVHLFEILTLTFLAYYLKNNKTSDRYYFLVIAIFFSIILFLTKQNIGLILALSVVFIVILQNTKTLKKILLSMSLLMLIYFLLLNLILFLFKSDLNSIYEITFRNDSKGSFKHVLLRFLLDPNNLTVLKKSFFYSLIIIGIFKYFDEFKKITQNVFSSKLIKYLVFVITPIFIIFYRSNNIFPFLSTLKSQIIPIAFASLFIAYILSFNYLRLSNFKIEPSLNAKSEDLKFLFYSLFAISYTNSMTSGFNFSGLLVPLSFSISYISLNFTRIFYNIKRVKFILIFALIEILLFSYTLNLKRESAYSWWDYKEESIFLKTGYKLPYPELEGFEVDSQTANLFSLINKKVNLYSRESNDVLFYPSIPIFYLLNKKNPPYKDVLYWFDVITDEQLDTFLFEINHKTPRLIVYLRPSRQVFDGHTILKGKHLKQIDIDNFFMSLVANGSYEIVDKIFVTGNSMHIKNLAEVHSNIPELYILKKN